MEFQESTEMQSLKEIVRFAPSVYEDRQTRNYDDFIRIVCNALKNAVGKICEDITKRHQAHGETRRFVHYTSLSTLVSMLKKSADGSNDYLRMYDSAHFNDPDEGQYLVRISEGKLESIGTNTNSTGMLTSSPLSQQWAETEEICAITSHYGGPTATTVEGAR